MLDNVKKVKVEKKTKNIANPIAYELEDKMFGNLVVKNSANAWWIDRVKVVNLISVFKYSATDEEACVYVGISVDQLKYFIELHPEFSAIKAQLKEYPNLKARRTVVDALGEADNAKWWLERKRKKEFSSVEDRNVVPSQHIHFHHNEEIKQIVFEAEEKLKEALINEIKGDKKKRLDEEKTL